MLINKRLCLILLIIISLFSLPALAEDDKKVVASVNPINLAIMNVNGGVEIASLDILSVRASANFDVAGLAMGQLICRGQLVPRLYPFNKAPKGFYIGPRAKVVLTSGNSSLFSEMEKESELLIGLGGIIGYQVVANNGFTIDFNGGASYYSAEESDLIIPSIAVNVGYAF